MLEVGLLHVHDQSPCKAGAQALLNGGNFVGRTVRRDDDLPVVVVQIVEGVEEFLLRGGRLGQKLNVVHHQNVHAAQAGAQIGGLLAHDGVDELVGQMLGGGQKHVGHGVFVLDEVADGVHQMGLAQSRVAVDEQRVVHVAGLLGHRQRRGVGQIVGLADDEVLKLIFRVERGVVGDNLLGRVLGVDELKAVVHAVVDAHRRLDHGLVAPAQRAHGLENGAGDDDFVRRNRKQTHGLDPCVVADGRNALAQFLRNSVPDVELFLSVGQEKRLPFAAGEVFSTIHSGAVEKPVGIVDNFSSF